MIAQAINHPCRNGAGTGTRARLHREKVEAPRRNLIERRPFGPRGGIGGGRGSKDRAARRVPSESSTDFPPSNPTPERRTSVLSSHVRLTKRSESDYEPRSPPPVSTRTSELPERGQEKSRSNRPARRSDGSQPFRNSSPYEPSTGGSPRDVVAIPL